MKRALVVSTLCSVLAAGSFGVLLAEDRLMDVPLPYSLAVAFASMLVLACALVALTERLRAHRPIVIRVAPAAPSSPARAAAVEKPPIAARRPRTAQGVVLLDCSSLAAYRETAA